jgi:hypothetical protein
MGQRAFLAAALILLGGMAFAQHAINPEPEGTTPATPAPAAPPVATAPEPATTPEAAAAPEPEVPQWPATAAAQPAPQVHVQTMLPAELDVYLIPAATREVCTTTDFGYGEIRRECRNELLPLARTDPALEGICVTRYGRRTCY